MTLPSQESEALRQQQLLGSLWSVHTPPGLGQGAAQGLAVYRANAAAVAERALAAAYPVVAQLIGAESFAAMAQHFWHVHPPDRGDLGEWGAALPAFMAAQEGLADEPYLPDCARLEWAAHQASRAGDAPGHIAGTALLNQNDPSMLRLRLVPGCALIHSGWPIASIWRAHQDHAFEAVQQAFATRRAQCAWVVRTGWAVQVHIAPPPDAAFLQAILAGQVLAVALEAAGEHFVFESWLIQALQQRWIAAFEA
jgi:hypothetical protein